MEYLNVESFNKSAAGILAQQILTYTAHKPLLPLLLTLSLFKVDQDQIRNVIS